MLLISPRRGFLWNKRIILGLNTFFWKNSAHL